MEHQPRHPLDWRILRSRHVVQDRWLSLRADTCQMPSGKIIEPFYILESPDYINVVALTPRQEVVLVREYRHGAQKTLLELPGGVVDAQDGSPEATARRELREETGYVGAVFEPLCVLSVNPARYNNLTYSFLARDVDRMDAQKLDATEEIEVVLVPLDRVFEMVRENQFLQATHTAALFYAMRAIGR